MRLAGRGHVPAEHPTEVNLSARLFTSPGKSIGCRLTSNDVRNGFTSRNLQQPPWTFVTGGPTVDTRRITLDLTDVTLREECASLYFNDPTITFSVMNATVRTILNTIVVAQGNSLWVVHLDPAVLMEGEPFYAQAVSSPSAFDENDDWVGSK